MEKSKKKKKKFRPTLIPRYLPGQSTKDVVALDLKLYNDFRKKIFYVKSKIDTKPPPMNPYRFITPERLRADAAKLFEIDKRNKQLLKNINQINRHGGRVDTFNPVAYARQSKWRAHELRMQQIAKHNRKIFMSILSTESEYSVAKMNQFWKHVVEKLHNVCKMPLVLLQKVTLDQTLRSQPSISGGLEASSERPLCFLEFEIKDLMYLGKVIFQLYYDFVPVTVQNFLSLCKGDTGLTYKGSPVHNIVRRKCLEMGDITKGNGKGGISIFGNSFPEENFVLKHTKGGVLSMIRVGKQENNSQFCITLDKVEKFDGKRVVFGKSVKGAEVLTKIEGLGRSVGRPPYNVIISNCGEYFAKK